MFETTLTATIIAAVSAAVAYFTWNTNKAVASLGAVVCLVAAAVAVLAGFLGTVILVLRIIPVLLLVLGIWIAWKVFTSRSEAGRR